MHSKKLSLPAFGALDHQPGLPQLITGVPMAARPLIAWSYARELGFPGGRVFFVTQHGQQRRLTEELSRSFLSLIETETPVHVIGVHLLQEADVDSASLTEKTKQRAQAIAALSAISPLTNSTTDLRLVVGSLEDMNNIFIQLEKSVSSARTIRVNDEISPRQLVEELVRFGYTGEQQVVSPGSYSQKGGHIDVYSILNKFPVRISFLGDICESLTLIDPVTKAPLEEVANYSIAPLPHLIPQPSTRQTPAFITWFQQQNPRPLVIFHSEDDYQQARTLYGGNHFASGSSLIFEDHPIILQQEQVKPLKASIGQIAAPTRLKEFADLSQQARANHRTIVASAWEESLDHPPDRVISRLPARVDGFDWPEARLAFIPAEEIRRPSGAPTAQKSQREHRLFIAQLKEQDFVVHIDHGIGKFVGMSKQQINGLTREYFIIQYAGGDKIFVPVEYAEKIHRYIGAANPTLHGLAQSNWHQITRKVKEESQKIARELLKLYAEREAAQGIPFIPFPAEEERLKESFDYKETEDQTRAIDEILEDMSRARPMDRLLCGDVGFGKTEVAIRAAYRAVLNGKQVAVLCPTTILTQQHLDTFRERMQPFGVRVGALSRFISTRDQRATLAQLADGRIDIVIGTHRVLSKDVNFKDLGLVIIDEEQRFGVLHKEKLKALRTSVDILTLTATPIPRTLNLALSGARDISTIETAPVGRLPIHTEVVPQNKELVRREIIRALAEHDQVYVLYNRVETIQGYAQSLRELVPEARIVVGHGQMHEHELSKAIADFDTGAADVLVCSTIIENGLDLPNANTLIVHNAPLFGLAQLYQIRGRIGRSSKQARAFFLYSQKNLTSEAKERLVTLQQTTSVGSGLQIATCDLEMRGAGSLLGKEQSGNVSEVGLQLYAELIQQSVQELEATTTTASTLESVVELPVDAFIPQEFAASAEDRYALYQKLGNIRDVGELARERERFFARHPHATQPVRHFFDVLEIKLLAQSARVLKINSLPVFGGGEVGSNARLRLSIEFAEALNPQIALEIARTNPAWRITGAVLKIDLAQLGEDWIAAIKTLLARCGEALIHSSSKKS